MKDADRQIKTSSLLYTTWLHGAESF